MKHHSWQVEKITIIRNESWDMIVNVIKRKRKIKGDNSAAYN